MMDRNFGPPPASVPLSIAFWTSSPKTAVPPSKRQRREGAPTADLLKVARAKDEWAERARAWDHGEDDDDREDECELAVLVAQGVDRSFFDQPAAEEAGVRYDLALSGDLRVVEMPRTPHSVATNEVAWQLKSYARGPAALLPAGNGLLCGSGGDVEHALGISAVDGHLLTSATSPEELSGGRQEAYPRLVVEVEHGHRTPRASMQHASRILHTPHIRAFLLLLLHSRNVQGRFAAAAVLWAKDAAGVVQLVRVVSFGPARAPVPVAAAAGGWVTAAAGPATVAVPVAAVFFQYWDPAAAAPMPVSEATPHLEIDLALLRAELDKTL
eukprot:m51a1_g13455 hypothetical protein (327) ;mRNA; r:308-1508